MNKLEKNIRLIGFDLDDTALNSKKELTPGVAKAIQDAIAAGITVLPATGRQITGIPAEVLAIPGMRYALTANGAGVYDLHENKRLYANCFSKIDALDALGQLRNFNCIITLYMNSESYSEPFDADVLAKAVSPSMLQYLKTSRIEVPSLQALLEQEGNLVDKYSVHFTCAKERLRAMAHFMKQDNFATTTSIPTNIELNARTANKGAGLLALAAHLGYTRAQVMAIGDNLNDIVMLQTVGFSVAMRNAVDEAKRVASAVTQHTCDEDGVAEAILAVLHSAKQT